MQEQTYIFCRAITKQAEPAIIVRLRRSLSRILHYLCLINLFPKFD
jgi:hypothetical protein